MIKVNSIQRIPSRRGQEKLEKGDRGKLEIANDNSEKEGQLIVAEPTPLPNRHLCLGLSQNQESESGS